MDLLIELPAVDIGHSWQEEYGTVPDGSNCFIFFPTTSIYSSLNSDWKQKKVCAKSLQSCPLFVTLWTVAMCVCVCVCVCVSCSVMSRSLGSHGLQPTRLCPWISLGKNTEVSCHYLLQGIFQAQELNPGPLP